MINDLPSCIGTDTVLYADDTSFFNCSTDFNNLLNLSENTLSQASRWFRANGFLLNDSKTQKIWFSLRDVPCNISDDTVKFLGLYMDCKLSWEPHIKYIANKLSRVIYLLRNLKNCVPDSYVRSAYFAFFQSIISYGILLWGNSSYIQKILVLQKKVVRIITDSENLEHCKPLFIRFGCLTVINLYIYHVLVYTKNRLPDYYCRKDVHTHNTRNSKRIDVPFQRLSKSLNSFEILGLKMINKLPIKFIELPIKRFKNELYSWLTKTPFYSVTEFFECEHILVSWV